jgi:DNA-binding NtrC family response regulator
MASRLLNGTIIIGAHAMPAASILVIDDDRLTRWTVSTLLGRVGYHIHEAATGRDGLAAIEEIGPNLVLLDIELPDMDGFAVLVKVREKHPDLPVLMMTADATAETARRALRLGAQGHLDKPIDSATLDAAVTRALESSPRSGHASR